ncbi:MAG TPA: metallophosphoesterase [Bryobacteraceae bacterium]|nr:metallophosphoesterase [Bryobacteraceae bacterium]
METERLTQFRSQEASLWQSAVDEVVASSGGSASAAASIEGGPARIVRPRQDDRLVAVGNDLAAVLAGEAQMPAVVPPGPAVGILDSVKFCSVTALRLARARVEAFFSRDDTELKRLEEELGAPFGSCDRKWLDVVATYVRHRIAAGSIPYRRHTQPDDFVIDGRLPDRARVILLADWGTGQPGAAAMLERIAARDPDAVIHLGDVYYSGTEYEFRNYFWAIWQAKLRLPAMAWGSKLEVPAGRPATFTLSGNHDLYAGGVPYYQLLDMLGQPASYFCLRNANWQFVAVDTGLHDANPLARGSVTELEPTEAEWLKRRVATAGSRKTILLSHHQLFSAYENIGTGFVNQPLLEQVRDVLPQLSVWFWGHEHNLVVYGRHLGVLARCIGHAAFPVAAEEVHRQNTDIPVEDVQLPLDQTGGLLQHGYVVLDLDGAAAHATYIQYDSVAGQEKATFQESY